jgi:radical SAM superfamily enzyme YgiQ (UPF0313 family)
MNITLILAASPNDPLKKNDPFMPLSLPLLAGSATGHDYTFVDMLAGETPNYDHPVDLVGISVRLTAEKTAYNIAQVYRKKGVKVVLGGPQISSVPFRAIDHADAVVVGEGEALWPVILDDLEKGNTLKDFYVSSPRPFHAEDHTVYQLDSYLDLSRVPNSIETRGLYKRKYVFDTVFAARGCAIDCDFCSVAHLFGKKTRLRPMEDVVNEIASFKGFYYLLDDTVFGRPYNYDYYMKLYDAIADMDPVRLWTGQANLDAAATKPGQEVIKKAARAGLVYAAIGIESINPKVLNKAGTINKIGAKNAHDITRRMKDHIHFIQEQGIAISGWFTLGYEEDTIDSFYETLEFCRETSIIPILCPLEALPGTRLFERLSKEGRVDEGRAINIIHPVLSDRQILDALKKTTKAGFSFGQILKRTRFYAKRFDRHTEDKKNRIKNKMEKTMFLFVLQNKLKKGVIGLANAE